MKDWKFKTPIDISDKTEHTDFVIVEGEIYPKNEIQVEFIEELPEVFDEDLLYEAYRDDQFDQKKRVK